MRLTQRLAPYNRTIGSRGKLYSALFLTLAAGCTPQSNTNNGPDNWTTSTSGSTSTVGGSEGGTSGGGGSESTGGSAGEDTGGSGGGAGGSLEYSPLDSACKGDKAFDAVGMVFPFPTPPGLASALSALTYDPGSRPLTLVLRANNGVVTASAAEEGYFTQSPTWTTVTLMQGGFATATPQASAQLRVTNPDTGETIHIALEDLTFSATTGADCSYTTVIFDAAIPASQANLELPSGTLGTLAGGLSGTPNGSMGWVIRGVFQAAATSFDFDALEPAP